MSDSLCDIINTFRINIIFLCELLTVTVDFPSSSAKPNTTTCRALQRPYERWKYKEGVEMSASVMHPNILRWFPLSLSEDFRV